MALSRYSPELLVIGGGILGAILGHQAAARGIETVVYRMRDALRPEADSLRNHGWLQSGILYAHDHPEVAARMRWSGKRMLREYGLRAPSSRGIFRVSNEADAEALVAGARQLRIGGLVERIPESEVPRILGPFHVPNRPCFWVPDAPFDQALLLQEARTAGKRAGAVYRDVSAPITLRPFGGEPGRFIVATPDGDFEPRTTIVAAGCSIPQILSALELTCPLAVFRSPLLNMTAANLLPDVPLFVDRSTELSTVRHDSATWGGSVLIVGNRKRTPVSLLEPMVREVSSQEAAELLELLPAEVRPTSASCRRTAGFKTESIGVNGTTSIHPWVYSPPEWPGLIAAVPGKATMSLATAELVLDAVVGGSANDTRDAGMPFHESSWVDDVRMHFDYPDLDERPA